MGFIRFPVYPIGSGELPAEVVRYHQDREKPGRPLHPLIPPGRRARRKAERREKPGRPPHLLIPGGLLAVGAFGAILHVAYAVWIAESMETALGIGFILVLLFPYFGGLLMFSYGFERFDWKRAIRRGLITGLIGLGVIVMCLTIEYLWKLLAAGAGAAGANGGDSDSSNSSESDSGSSPSHFTLNSGHQQGRFIDFLRLEKRHGRDLRSTCPYCRAPLSGMKCPNCSFTCLSERGQSRPR